MAIYGLQADINANQGRNVNLYIPGKTKLTPQDVFLGGTGTGIDDSQLNGAIRVFGDTAQGTAMALNDYNNDLSSQIRAAIAQNAAPRADASRGIPSLARQAQEIQQAQGKISNDMNAAQLTGNYNNAPTLAQKTFNQNVNQDTFSNDLARQAQAIQDAQFNAKLNQGESQFGRTLASGNYNSAADRAARAADRAARETKPTQSDITTAATGQAQDYLNAWASGTARDDNGNLLPRATSNEIQQWVKDHSGELTTNKVNVSTLGKWAADTFQWNP